MDAPLYFTSTSYPLRIDKSKATATPDARIVAAISPPVISIIGAADAAVIETAAPPIATGAPTVVTPIVATPAAVA